MSQKNFELGRISIEAIVQKTQNMFRDRDGVGLLAGSYDDGLIRLKDVFFPLQSYDNDGKLVFSPEGKASVYITVEAQNLEVIGPVIYSEKKDFDFIVQSAQLENAVDDAAVLMHVSKDGEYRIIC